MVGLGNVTLHWCKELMCYFMFGMNLVWVIIAFWPILLDLCPGRLSQVRPTFRVYGNWNVKLTGCIIDQWFSPFCILYPVGHFVQKETSPSSKQSISFPKKFIMLLINGPYFVTSCLTQLSWPTGWETLLYLCAALAPFLYAFIRWCFGTRLVNHLYLYKSWVQDLTYPIGQFKSVATLACFSKGCGFAVMMIKEKPELSLCVVLHVSYGCKCFAVINENIWTSGVGSLIQIRITAQFFFFFFARFCVRAAAISHCAQMVWLQSFVLF